jgi:16S rRNA (cytosine967-C5)-methyltransferase
MGAQKPREIAAQVLRRYADGSGWLETILEEELHRNPVAPTDRALAQELAFGAVRWQGTLDWVIARKTGGRTQKTALQILLRLGLYQLFWLDRIPDHAAVNESVQLARELGFGPQSGFINALLRGCLREREQLERELAELKLHEPALGYSHPEWLCSRWEKRWGGDKLRLLLEWNNTPPALFIRANTLKCSAEQLAAQLDQEGVDFEPRSFDWVVGDLVFQLKSHPSLVTLPSFQQGMFYVQDPSTLLAVRELAPLPGERVLDMCAAPGGKTTLIAQQMENRGTIVAGETNPERCQLIQQNCHRLGVDCVQIREAMPVSPEPGGKFDRVLVDAPCSNTGVMRRRVELRWRIQPAEIERLRRVQLELLRQAAARLKPDGTLVYSTCSLEPDENGAVIAEFLSSQPGFRSENERELVPFVEGVDGAYVARLRKN